MKFLFIFVIPFLALSSTAFTLDDFYASFERDLMTNTWDESMVLVNHTNLTCVQNRFKLAEFGKINVNKAAFKFVVSPALRLLCMDDQGTAYSKAFDFILESTPTEDSFECLKMRLVELASTLDFIKGFKSDGKNCVESQVTGVFAKEVVHLAFGSYRSLGIEECMQLPAQDIERLVYEWAIFAKMRHEEEPIYVTDIERMSVILKGIHEREIGCVVSGFERKINEA
jgi:hypothetical protein